MRIEMPGGYIETSGINDIRIIATDPNHPDPCNVVFASAGGVSLGAVSWGILRADGGVEQKVLFQGKVNEQHRFRTDVKEIGGEFSIHVHDGIKHFVNGEIRDDASMVPVLIARFDKVWIRELVTAAEYPDGLPGWQGVPPSNPNPIPVPNPPHTENHPNGPHDVRNVVTNEWLNFDTLAEQYDIGEDRYEDEEIFKSGRVNAAWITEQFRRRGAHGPE